MLMSKYGLDVQPFNTEGVDIRWENCSLRAWLNDDFYNTAFTDEEKEKINTKTVKNGENPFYSDSTASADTLDKVFLLSIEGATNKAYNFSEDRGDYDDLRKCAPTEYATAKGAYISDIQTKDGLFTSLWWLRTVGQYENETVYVIGSGYIRKDGWNVNRNDFVIRPVIAISLQ